MLALDVLNFPRFNLLCLPGVTTADVDAVTTALAYCQTQNAFLLVDPDPSVTAANAVTAGRAVRGRGRARRAVLAAADHAGLDHVRPAPVRGRRRRHGPHRQRARRVEGARGARGGGGRRDRRSRTRPATRYPAR